jgi:hypothetical protein
MDRSVEVLRNSFFYFLNRKTIRAAQNSFFLSTPLWQQGCSLGPLHEAGPTALARAAAVGDDVLIICAAGAVAPTVGLVCNLLGAGGGEVLED